MEYCTVCYIEKDDKVLMLYRNKKKNDINKGKWIGVGGHIEKNETPYECCLREIKEETGLTAKSLVPIGYITFVTDGEDMGIHVFSCKDFTGNTITCNEGELHWIQKKDLLSLDIWETDKYMLQKISKNDYSYFMIKAVYANNEVVENKIEYY